MIVTDEGGPAVGVGTHHADAAELFLIQRQNAVVFQQDDALFRRFNGGSHMLLALHGAVGNVVELRLLAVHDAQ